MATYNKFQPFVEHIAEGVHDLGSDALTVALTNTAPSAGYGVLADITEISYTNCSSRALVTASSAQTSGTYKLTINDLVITATGGAIPTFRYVVVYNDTPAGTPTDPLICWFDYGSAIDLADTETLTIDFDGANGLLQLA